MLLEVGQYAVALKYLQSVLRTLKASDRVPGTWRSFHIVVFTGFSTVFVYKTHLLT
jgi:hypothetical protein